MTDESPQLDYAARPHPLRSARSRRVAIVVGALLLLAGIAWVTPRAFRRLQVTHWQRQCLDYAAPADRVVFDNDPAEIPKLLALPLPYQGSLAVGHAYLIPPQYRKLIVSQSVGTAFLHERITPQGEPRRVAVDLFGGTMPPPNNTMMFNATVLDATSAARSARSMVTITRGDGASITLQPGDKLRVFAGQPDPADASHFTIDYVLNGTRHTIDGWLKADGLVIIEVRD